MNIVNMDGVSDINEDPVWFVLRVTYQRELRAKEYLDSEHIENFVPTKLVRSRGRLGRFVWSREVALHNYVFVRSTKSVIDYLKQYRLPWLRYVMRSRDGSKEILTVPEEQMRNFIAVAGNTDEQVIFLDPEEIDLTCGDRVRILGGAFEGVEGVFVRINNSRGKRVVVRIDGVAAVATASIPPALIEKL